MNFSGLVQSIEDIHLQSRAVATKAVNTALTLRNWLIGAHIHEFELNGEDRAGYGDGLFLRIAQELAARAVPNCDKIRLYRYRDFYRLYPQIVAALSPQFQKFLPQSAKTTKRRCMTGFMPRGRLELNLRSGNNRGACMCEL